MSLFLLPPSNLPIKIHCNNKMNIAYRVYINLFWCFRGIHRIFSEEQTPIQMNVHESSWLSVDATMLDGSTQDVTDTVRNCLRHDAVITPDILERITRLENVESWAYLTQTLEYNKITAEGVVNGL